MDDRSNFTPPFYLKNRHIQSAMNSLGPRKLRARRILQSLRSEQLQLEADDGTRLLAELDRASPDNDRLAFLIHGWEGSSKSAYQVTTAEQLLRQGIDVLRVNLRDHGDSYALNREVFNSTRTPEVASALKNFLGDTGYTRNCLIGYSLGGSFALRIAADSGESLRLKTSIAISPPVNPASAMRALNDGWFAYERYFYGKYRSSVATKLSLFPELGYQEELQQASNVEELNKLLIPLVTEYRDVEKYYAAYALTGDRLKNLTIPSHLITAEDDPIIPVSDIDSISPNKFLRIDRQKYGGHCGFIEDLTAHSWVEKRIVDLVQQHLGTAEEDMQFPDQSSPETVSA